MCDKPLPPIAVKLPSGSNKRIMDFRTSGHISPSSSLRVTTPTNPLPSPVLGHPPIPIHLGGSTSTPVPPHLPGLLYYPGLPLGNRNLPPLAVPPSPSPISALSNNSKSSLQLQQQGITARTATVPPLAHLPLGNNHVATSNASSSSTAYVNPHNLSELRSSPASLASSASSSSSSFAAALRILAKQAGVPNSSTDLGNSAEREVEEIAEAKNNASSSSAVRLPSPRPLVASSMSKSASPSKLHPPYRHSSRTSPVNLHSTAVTPANTGFSHSTSTAVTKATEAVQGRPRSPPPVVTIAPTPSLVGMYNHERKGLERPPISSVAGPAGLSTGLGFPPYGHPSAHPSLPALNLPPHATPEHYPPWLPHFPYPYSQDMLRSMGVGVATSGSSVRVDEPLFSMAGNNYVDNSMLSSVVTSRSSLLAPPSAPRAEDYFLGARHSFLPFRPDLHYGNDPVHSAMLQHQMAAASNHALRLEEQMYLERFGLLRPPMPLNSYPGLPPAMTSMPGARYPPELLSLGPDVLAQANAAMQQRIKAEEEHRHRERLREEERTKKEGTSVNRPLATVQPREGSSIQSQRKDREHHSKSKEKVRESKEREQDSHVTAHSRKSTVSLPSEGTPSKTSVKVHAVTPLCATTPVVHSLPRPPSPAPTAAPTIAPVVAVQSIEPSPAPRSVPNQLDDSSSSPLNLTSPVIRSTVSTSNPFSIDSVLNNNNAGLSCRPVEDLAPPPASEPSPKVESSKPSNLPFLEGHKWPWEMLPNHAAHHEAFSPWHNRPSTQPPVVEGKSKLDLLEEKLKARQEERKRKRGEREEESESEDVEADSLEDEDEMVKLKKTRDWPILNGPPEITVPSQEQRQFLRAFALVTPAESCDAELKKCKKRLALHRELSLSPEPSEKAQTSQTMPPTKPQTSKSPAPTAKRRFFENLQLAPSGAQKKQTLEMNWQAILADRRKRSGKAEKKDSGGNLTLPALQVEVESSEESTPFSTLLQIAATDGRASQEAGTGHEVADSSPNIASWLRGLPSLGTTVPFPPLPVSLPLSETKNVPVDSNKAEEESSTVPESIVHGQDEEDEEDPSYRWAGPEAVIEAYLQHQQEKESEKRFLISRWEMLPLRLAERQAHLSSLCLRLSALVADQRKLKEEEESHTKGLQSLLAQWQRLAHHVSNANART